MLTFPIPAGGCGCCSSVLPCCSTPIPALCLVVTHIYPDSGCFGNCGEVGNTCVPPCPVEVGRVIPLGHLTVASGVSFAVTILDDGTLAYPGGPDYGTHTHFCFDFQINFDCDDVLGLYWNARSEVPSSSGYDDQIIPSQALDCASVENLSISGTMRCNLGGGVLGNPVYDFTVSRCQPILDDCPEIELPLVMYFKPTSIEHPECLFSCFPGVGENLRLYYDPETSIPGSFIAWSGMKGIDGTPHAPDEGPDWEQEEFCLRFTIGVFPVGDGTFNAGWAAGQFATGPPEGPANYNEDGDKLVAADCSGLSPFLFTDAATAHGADPCAFEILYHFQVSETP